MWFVLSYSERSLNGLRVEGKSGVQLTLSTSSECMRTYYQEPIESKRSAVVEGIISIDHDLKAVLNSPVRD